jgi:hypothetical protein
MVRFDSRRFVDQLAGRVKVLLNRRLLVRHVPFDPSLIQIGLHHDGEYYEVELGYVCASDFAASVTWRPGFGGNQAD